MKTKGWFRDYHRHSLAAHGIRSSFYKDKSLKIDGMKTDLPTTRRLFRMSETWKRGEKGKLDARERSNVLPLTKANFEYWKKHPSTCDIEGIDTPVEDVEEIIINKTSFYIGGNTPDERQRLFDIISSVLSNFTKSEIKELQNIYIQFAKYTKNINATQVSYKEGGNIGSAIFLNPDLDDTKLSVALTHDLVHSLHSARGKRNQKETKDEKETELETLARTPVKEFVGYGGYYNLKSDNTPAIIHDKILTSSSLSKNLKGKPATESIKKLPKSKINKILR